MPSGGIRFAYMPPPREGVLELSTELAKYPSHPTFEGGSGILMPPSRLPLIGASVFMKFFINNNGLKMFVA